MIRFALCALLALGVPAARADDAPKKPNVVVFLTDDLSQTDCSPYGGTDVPTPNMARVAKAGMTFTSAFVASPSCAPSRAALLTGLDPVRNGAVVNHSRPRADVKKWPALFRALGYEVVAFGKVGHAPKTDDYGFDASGASGEGPAGAAEWLAARKGNKPLCLMVGTRHPHVPWPKESDVRVTALPPKTIDTPETRAGRARYLAAVASADADLGRVYDAALKHLGANTLFAFSSDHGAQFPFGKWNCYDLGVRVPLVIAWPGRVKAGSTADALVSWVDLLPTALAACGGAPPEGLSGSSFLDVLTGARAAHRERAFFTHSRDGTMNEYPMRAVRTARWKYIRNLDPAGEHHTHIDRGNVERDGRGIWDSWVAKAKTDPAAAALVKRYHTRPAEELYDVTADPWELKNLAADPAHADRLKALRADLDAWMKANGDEGMATEKKLWDEHNKKKKE